ncbi:neocarzinostatin apoprotein domain-containing protein [Streptomyces sp. SAJ15]|uniref:neocarzinostatin apoprotein domain-containing protein n=1 Tax=Streptomyces sp. SAJ15 TaxID=2011095 RepID=UPI0021B41110|nr:neocarzinostatin apoprotein domain-containing protein [Streptomyces sp. SAJ15]
MRTRRRRGHAVPALVGVLLALLATVLVPVERARADAGPVVEVSTDEAGVGGAVTVRGTGWRPGALLTLLICGQNMIGGTNTCANAEGRAVTVGADGSFSRRLPVAEPPAPCPCVVHAATVTGKQASARVAFTVAGHPVKPLPPEAGRPRLRVLDVRLDGSSGLLTWFGAPARRTLVVTVGNLGTAAARDPVFQLGTSHGVFAPEWEERRWRGTIPAGRKAQVRLSVELSAGAHGDYLVSLRHGRRLLAEQPWTVGRPWGVTLFWILLGCVVPVAVFRAGMAVVDRLRPPAVARAPDEAVEGGAAALPWFVPEPAPHAEPGDDEPRVTEPRAAGSGHASAPSDDRPTPKGTT